MKFFKITTILMISVYCVFAGNGKIAGIVLDEQTKEPIIGANVILFGTTLDSATDLMGEYTIQNVEPGTYKLQVMYIGYATVIIEDIIVKENSTTKVDIWMIPESLESETIVIESKKEDNKDGTSKSTNRTNSYNRSYSEGKDDSYNEELFSDPPPPPHPIAKEKSKPKVVVSKPVENKIPGFSGLKAGFADDNEQFNYFLNFLKEYGQDIEYYPIRIEERIQLRILDRDNKPVPNANIKIKVNNKTFQNGKTYADGSFFIYPLQVNLEANFFEAEVEYQNQNKRIKIDRNGPRQIDIVLDADRESYQNIPIDLLFILDVTGSMGEELERLKTSIEIINLNIASLNIKPDVRFGMVSYRDQDDDFVTKLIPFTGDLQAFQNELSNLSAKGGGDDPEDLQSALKDALQKMNWNEDGLRLGFIITDAPAHLNYDQKYTYVKAVEDAKSKAIKLFTVGTGGLEIDGEYILRQISQYTYGKYIFLTYGEEGESEGGKPGSVSHHTGSNFQTDKLEAIIIRFAKEELSHLSDIEVVEDERFIQAMKVDFEEKEETVEILFTAAIDELWDYSSIALPDPVNLNVIPLSVSLESLESTAEYFTERLNFALSRMAGINLIERKDLQFIADELKIQLSGIVEVSDAAKIGEWIGADYQIIGNLYYKDGNYETYLKLVRVNTAEILSVTKLVIDYRLGL